MCNISDQSIDANAHCRDNTHDEASVWTLC